MLHERIAKALGWPIDEVRRMSLHALRELVRQVSPKLAEEITIVIATGEVVRRHV